MRSVVISSSFLGAHSSFAGVGSGTAAEWILRPCLARNAASCLGTCSGLISDGSLSELDAILVAPFFVAVPLSVGALLALGPGFGCVSSPHILHACFLALWCGAPQQVHTHFVLRSSSAGVSAVFLTFCVACIH